jgi:hypothetical protein
MRRYLALILLAVLPWLVAAIPNTVVDREYLKFVECATGSTCVAVSPQQAGTLNNSSTASSTNAAVTVTISAAAATKVHIYQVSAWCSAGTSNLVIKDGSTTIWQTPATAIGTTLSTFSFAVPITISTNSNGVITLAACGASNTGTLNVQADQY